MIVVFGSAKGDQGKTTAAFNMAVQRARRGKRVLFIDADFPQTTASKWADRRHDAGHTPAIITEIQAGKMIGPNIEHKAQDYDDVIVDTRGADTGELRGAALVADVLVSPVQASQAAVETLDYLSEVLTPIRAQRPNLRVLLLTSRVIPRAGSMSAREHVAGYCAVLPIYSVAETVIHTRSAHETALKLGLGVAELTGKANAKAQEEMLLLEKEIWGDV